METISTVIILLSLVFSVLYLVLLWKIWMMTDDVRALKEYFLREGNKSSSAYEAAAEPSASATPSEPSSSNAPSAEPSTPKDYDVRLDTLKSGDRVRRKSDGKEMRVESVAYKQIMCSTGLFSKMYMKRDLEFIK